MQRYVAPFESYLRHEQNASEMTVTSYLKDLQAYIDYCTDYLGEMPPAGEGDVDLIRGWLSSQMDKGLKAASVARRLSAIKAFYRYLLRISAIKSSPASRVRAPKGELPLPVYVPTEEIEHILEEGQGIRETDPIEFHRDRLILSVLYECGLRRSELANLLDKDVDLQRRQLKVLGKGRKERIVPFGQSLAEQMELWRELRGSLTVYDDTFFVSLRGQAMAGGQVYRIVRRALEHIPHLAQRGAHTLRHSFATDMLNSGADLVAIKELMGHSSLGVTVRYTHTSFRQLQQMYQAHPRAQKQVKTMDIRIQALHFDATDQLKEFIQKKVDKLSRFAEDIQAAEVILKVIKPEVANNKEASIKLILGGADLFADKVADSFEEAIDLATDALKHQLEKRKNAHK